MLDRDNNLYLIHLNTLVTSFLDGGWKLKGEVTCESLLGVKELIKNHSNEITYNHRSSMARPHDQTTLPSEQHRNVPSIFHNF